MSEIFCTDTVLLSQRAGRFNSCYFSVTHAICLCEKNQLPFSIHIQVRKKIKLVVFKHSLDAMSVHSVLELVGLSQGDYKTPNRVTIFTFKNSKSLSWMPPAETRLCHQPCWTLQSTKDTHARQWLKWKDASIMPSAKGISLYQLQQKHLEQLFQASLPTSHVIIYKIVMTPVTYTLLYSISKLLFTQRKPKRPSTWLIEASTEHDSYSHKLIYTLINKHTRKITFNKPFFNCPLKIKLPTHGESTPWWNHWPGVINLTDVPPQGWEASDDHP